MAMSVGTAGEEMCDINTTPLIDVMLVLLIMLILTLPIMTHAVKLDMPNWTSTEPWSTTAMSCRMRPRWMGISVLRRRKIPNQRFICARIDASSTTPWRRCWRPPSAIT
jgi:biopolymer transport protein ExbD